MKIRWPEQLDKPLFKRATPGVKRWLKRLMSKTRRRDGKLNKEDSIKQNRYKGWES